MELSSASSSQSVVATGRPRNRLERSFTVIRQDNTNLEIITKQAEAQEWIEAVTNEPFPERDFCEALKDGVLLCKLAMKVKPGSIKKINASKAKLKMGENVEFFLQVCKSMGMRDFQLFHPLDIMERRNLLHVVNCIHTFADVAAKNGFSPIMERLSQPSSPRGVVPLPPPPSSSSSLAGNSPTVAVRTRSAEAAEKKAAEKPSTPPVEKTKSKEKEADKAKTQPLEKTPSKEKAGRTSSKEHAEKPESPEKSKEKEREKDKHNEKEKKEEQAKEPERAPLVKTSSNEKAETPAPAPAKEVSKQEAQPVNEERKEASVTATPSSSEAPQAAETKPSEEPSSASTGEASPEKKERKEKKEKKEKKDKKEKKERSSSLGGEETDKKERSGSIPSAEKERSSSLGGETSNEAAPDTPERERHHRKHHESSSSSSRHRSDSHEKDRSESPSRHHSSKHDSPRAHRRSRELSTPVEATPPPSSDSSSSSSPPPPTIVEASSVVHEGDAPLSPVSALKDQEKKPRKKSVSIRDIPEVIPRRNEPEETPKPEPAVVEASAASPEETDDERRAREEEEEMQAMMEARQKAKLELEEQKKREKKDSSLAQRRTTNAMTQKIEEYSQNLREAIEEMNVPVSALAAHKFERATFGKPTWCQLCDRFIWGFSKQGYACSACGCAVHTKCLAKIPNNCGAKLKDAPANMPLPGEDELEDDSSSSGLIPAGSPSPSPRHMSSGGSSPAGSRRGSTAGSSPSSSSSELPVAGSPALSPHASPAGSPAEPQRRSWKTRSLTKQTGLEAIEKYYEDLKHVAEKLNNSDLIEAKIKENRQALPVEEEERVDFREVEEAERTPEQEEEERRERMRIEVINEIMISERYYVRDLDIIVNTFMKPLTSHKIIQVQEAASFFSNVELLFKVNQEILHNLLAEFHAAGNIQLLNIGRVFLRMVEYLKIYSIYSSNYANALSMYDRWMKENKQFAVFVAETKQRPECRSENILGFLIKPIQRICKYPLLFKELLKWTPSDHVDYLNIESCFKKVNEVADYVNEKKRSTEFTRKMMEIAENMTDTPKDFQLIQPARQFIREGTLVKVNKAGKHQERHFFLFSDILLYAKVQYAAKKTSYQFKGLLPLGVCVVNELEDKDDLPNAFEVVLMDAQTKRKYQLGASSAAERNMWVADIKKLTDAFLEKAKDQRNSKIAPIFED